MEIVKITGYIAGSLQIIASIFWLVRAITAGYFDYYNVLSLLVGVSLGVFIILLSTKLKV